MKVRVIKRRLGQNTAEYLIILVLIAGSALAVFPILGKAVQRHVRNITVMFTGHGDTAIKVIEDGDLTNLDNTVKQAGSMQTTNEMLKSSKSSAGEDLQ